MNNAGTVALRIAGRCLHESPWSWPPASVLQAAARCLLPLRTSPRTASCIIPLTSRFPRPSGFSSRNFSSSPTTSFQPCLIAQKLKAYDSKAEQGVAFRQKDLTQEELQDVFGAVVPPKGFANRLLKVLNGRRIDGTLDLDLPKDMQSMLKTYPYAMDSALYWLRKEEPFDEDAAIIARIEREESLSEQDNPADLQQRATDLGLYAPQSGNYRAKLSETEDDVFGQSELDKIRAENIAQAEKEEEELNAQINKLQADVKEQQAKEIALRPDQGLEAAQEIRPPNEFERWRLRQRNKAQSKLTIDSPEVKDRTLRQRLLPSLVFAAIVCAASIFCAQYWVAPKRSERMFPDVSLSFATVGTLIAINLFIYGAWSLPPFWRILNTYFLATPGYPRALSMLGNVFSHQSTKHLLSNMAGLLIFGLSLHEDVGRGTFMAIYLCSGVLGSFASLASFAVKGVFNTSSLGASGAVWGILAAYSWIHANETFTFVFLPSAWQDTLSFKGWMFLTTLVLSQIVGILSPLKQIDYISHFVGIVVGISGAQWWKQTQEATGALRNKKRSPRWYDVLLGKTSNQAE